MGRPSLTYNLQTTPFFSAQIQGKKSWLKENPAGFQLVSGLKVNISKSLLVGIWCSYEITQSLAASVHCKHGRLPIIYLGVPFIYLGLPLGAKPRSISLRNLIVNKF